MIYLGLGSNLGHRAGNLRRAVQLLGRVIEVSAVSPMYRTPPWGVTEQPDFLNMCVAGESALDPAALLLAVKAIEQQMGREQTVRWGPRLIDIDILLAGDQIIETEVDGRTLTIPHPRIAERAFVLMPLAAIAPDVVHPTHQQTIISLLAQTNTDDITPYAPLTTRNSRFDWSSRTYIMGILNVTPDSFSGDGTGSNVALALRQTAAHLANGADIIDIGGESTRPNGEPVTAAMEQARVLPIITAVRREFADVPISIDTYRAETARLALAAGADWVNDIWGLQHDAPTMAETVAQAGCPVVIMHNGRNRPRLDKEDGAGGYYGYFHYDDLLGEVKQELQDSVDLALAAGVQHEQIILDPGIGFGKTAGQNLTLLNRLDELQTLNYPILLGASRKGFIGHLLGGVPADQRVAGTVATTVLGIDRGADIVRVHDVKENGRAAKIADAISR